jgi:hypothetical protein
MAAATPSAVPAADPAAAEALPLTADDVAAWLVQKTIAGVIPDTDGLLFEAVNHPQWDQLIMFLHKHGVSADAIGEHAFDAVLDKSDLPRVQRFTESLKLTADQVCTGGRCPALVLVANATDFAKVDWLVNHFGLADRKDMREWVPRFCEALSRGSGGAVKMARHLAALVGPMSDAAVIQWLLDEQDVGRETLDEPYCMLARAACHPQWKKLICRLAEFEKFDTRNTSEYTFAEIVRETNDLERVQWIAAHFELTTEKICASDGCPALHGAMYKGNIPIMEWLVTHFSLADFAGVRESIPDAVRCARQGGQRCIEAAARLKELFGL